MTPEQLIDTATQGSPVPVEELCTALVWRVATLTDEPDDDASASAPPDPLDPESEPPHDLHLLPSPHRAEPVTGTAVPRIVELNRATLDYYTQMYSRSWAPDYLRERLGTDLSDEPRFTVGYAPPGPTSLIRHLTGAGATEQELLDAGLARHTERGHLIDAFRDRLVFPIYNGPDLVGFIGRRNPTKDDSQYGGPKYLNTRTTAAFTKGEQLFGLTEGTADAAAGALPVLVEGPLDAIAITIATGDQAIGIAPLGTAFTTGQAAQIRPYFRENPSRIVIATDPDPAGWKSAQAAFWQLAQYGADPQHLILPAGLDPADLLRSQGPRALQTAIAGVRPFAESLTASLIGEHAADPDSPATRLRLVHETGQIIGALPPRSWIPHIEQVTNQLALPPGILHLEVADAGHAWTSDPDGNAALRIAEINHPRAPGYRNPRADVTQRWRDLLEKLHPGISATSGWSALAPALRQAHTEGHDLPSLLPALMDKPLPEGERAPLELRYRLIAACELERPHAPVPHRRPATEAIKRTYRPAPPQPPIPATRMGR